MTKSLKPSQVAKLMQVNVQTVYRLIRKKEIPSYKLGGSVRVPAEWVRRRLDGEANK